MRLRRAEHDHPREIANGFARRRIGKRLIQLVEMRVAVHEKDRLAELQSEIAQSPAKLREPVRPLAFDSSLEIRVGLGEDKHSRETAPRGKSGAILKPREDCGHARPILGVHRRCPAEIIVAALDVQADEEDVGGDPAHVLAIVAERRRAAVRLPLKRYAALAEARAAGFEELAEALEALDRIEAASVTV